MASIRQLDPIVASRIAAGEVVERPSSVLRELLDNAIDAKATKISVYIEQGGIKSLTVIDNGSGMSADDLELACRSHATSKVRTLEDLFNLSTLGFRGEALSSISACSRLTISSNGNRITVDNGVQSPVVPGGIERGTSVSMEDLFENIPARKQFLKRPQSEATDCRKTFIEKALGFPEIELLFFSEGEQLLHYEASDRKTRALRIMSADKSFMPAKVLQMSYKGENTELLAISSDPSCYRRDRGQIKILVNNRIIDSYQLVQAVTSAYSAALPGGAFPYFYLFIDDNPALVDFNVHPAKRECKIRNQSQIYGAITTMIRQALLKKEYETDVREPLRQEPLFDPQPRQSEHVSEIPSSPYRAVPKPESRPATASKPFDPSWFENARTILAKAETKRSPSEVSTTKIIPDYRYIGQVFNTFLVVELKDRLMFIDQHALHERLLYDEIRAQKDVQRLMVPYPFEVERSVDDYLQENSVIYSDYGIELTRKEPLLWEMASMPATCRKNEQEIVSYIQTQTGDIESVQKGLFAIIACHAAIKAGDELDAVTAAQLVRKCFELERMVCPHGREFTFSVSKEYLYKEVGRIV
ncbi:MAG: DNA mismatch repair endonuclease MutL [Sphaerochaetaceae bacterium]|nr:DNA mismatch repair endonuclease MutL [Sphaerochaetaceae bacterium]